MKDRRPESSPHRGEVAYIGLGGNVGDRLGQMRHALFALITHPEIDVTAISRIYESEHVGPDRQPPYLNACAEIETRLAPGVLLAVLQGLENRQGREPDSHGQPRPIDLDILLYGRLTSSDPALTLPHPELRRRAFVLEPLGEIAPDYRFPDSQETVTAACAKMRQARGPWVRLLDEAELPPRVEWPEEANWRAALAVYCR